MMEYFADQVVLYLCEDAGGTRRSEKIAAYYRAQL